jgi:hypothetical protein
MKTEKQIVEDNYLKRLEFNKTHSYWWGNRSAKLKETQKRKLEERIAKQELDRINYRKSKSFVWRLLHD